MVFAIKKWGQNFLVDNNLLNKIINTIKSQQKDVSWSGTESMSIVGLLANNGDKSRKIIDNIIVIAK